MKMMRDQLSAQFLSQTNFQQAWTKVADNNGCAGVDGETIANFAFHASENLNNLRQSLLSRKYRPLPSLQFSIPKKTGGWRHLSVPTVRDRIVQQALLTVLHPILEREFEPTSFAYRPTRGHHLAVQQVDYWHKRDYDWILDADIVTFFDNVLHSRLLIEVSERIHHPLVIALVRAWLSAGILTENGLILPKKGLHQGAVISPILANVYLDDFDEAISETKLKLIRYADDFLLMGRSQQQVVRAREKVSKLLGEMGLALHPQKTQITNFNQGFRFLGQVFAGDLILPVKSSQAHTPRNRLSKKKSNLLRLIHADAPLPPTAIQQSLLAVLKTREQPIPPPLFVVFGYKLREKQPINIRSKEQVWRAGMSTLYLVQQGTVVSKEEGRFCLKPPEEAKLEVLIEEIERILVFGNSQLTSAVISTCLQRRVPVIFLSQTGEYKGHLYSAESCDLEVQEAQFRYQHNEKFQLQVAKAIIVGKLENARNYLLKINRRRKISEVDEIILNLEENIASINTEEITLKQLRGYEGISAKNYFQGLGKLITNSGFSLTERNRRPPKDPVNSLLSFGYTLLHNNVLSLILAEGLNPYLGNLHGSERKESFLAFDLMEEFRSPIVDTLVMTLINQKILRPTDFTWPNEQGGVYLIKASRRIFLKHFEERISDQIAYPGLQNSVSYRRIIQLQVQRYKQALLSDIPYKSFIREE